MKILKVLFGVLFVIISFALVVAAFTEKNYAVERDITIDRPNEAVFNYIKFLKNQDNYSVWAMKDPNMKKEYRGTDGAVGFVATWESDQSDVGKGEQEIKKISAGNRIDTELRFLEPFQATDHAYMVTEALSENQTKTKWGFNGQMKYPMNLMLLFINMEEMLGKDLETGLKNLKTNLEK
ncbi:MAG TPA: SRPBCC family protein [Cytophagaceae bacterium]|jgi:hypothetical protein